MEYSRMIEQQEQVARNEFRRSLSGYKCSKGVDSGNHAIPQAIGYAEFHTNKLNGQRPFDRPFGNAERTRYYSSTRNDWTYSDKVAKAWAKAGEEVFKYDSKGYLVEITNSHKATRRKYAGIRIKYSYNK